MRHNLNNKKFAIVLTLCFLVLEFESCNTKALFRRAKANLGLGDVWQTRCDLKVAVEVEPDKAEIVRELARVETGDPLVDETRKNSNYLAMNVSDGKWPSRTATQCHEGIKMNAVECDLNSSGEMEAEAISTRSCVEDHSSAHQSLSVTGNLDREITIVDKYDELDKPDDGVEADSGIDLDRSSVDSNSTFTTTMPSVENKSKVNPTKFLDITNHFSRGPKGKWSLQSIYLHGSTYRMVQQGKKVEFFNSQSMTYIVLLGK